MKELSKGISVAFGVHVLCFCIFPGRRRDETVTQYIMLILITPTLLLVIIRNKWRCLLNLLRLVLIN